MGRRFDHDNQDLQRIQELGILERSPVYRLAKDCLRSHRNRRDTARAFVQDMNDWGDGKTPNGARYTIANVYAAMKGL